MEESLISACVHVLACPLNLCACVCFSVPGFAVLVFEQMPLWICLSLNVTVFIDVCII